MTGRIVSYKVDTEITESGEKTRSQRMIDWIVSHKEKIDKYNSGNIQFSFVKNTLKVKDENFEDLKF